MLNNTSNNALILIGILLLLITIGAPWYTDLYYVNLLDYKTYLVSISLLVFLPIFWFFNFPQALDKIKFSKSQLYLLVFFIISSLSVFWSDDYSLFLNKWFIYVFGFIVFSIALKIEHNYKNYIFISLILASVSLLISGIGIFQYLFGFPVHFILPYENIPASTFGNKNAANQLIVLVFPAIVFLLIAKVNKTQFLIGVLALVSTLFYVYYATTKSAWIALSFEALTMLVYWFYVRKNFPSSISALFKVFSFLLIISFFVVLDFTSTKSSFNSDSKVDLVLSSLSDRYSSAESPRKRIWRSAFNIANESPVYGHGLGNFPYELAVEGSLFRLKRVHNDLLEMYVELGLVGIVVFILFLFYFFKDWISINQANSKKDSLFFNLLMIAFSGSFINMMVSWPFQSVYGVVIFSIFSGLIVSKANQVNTLVYAISFSKPIKFVVMSAVYIVVIFSFLVTKSWVNSLSNFYYHSGTVGYKFNLRELVKYAPLIPYSDIHLSKIAESYWRGVHHDRALKVYKIATNLNSDNMLALYRQFIVKIDNSEIDNAKAIMNIMLKDNEIHPLTLRAILNFHRANKDIESAIGAYKFYKGKFNIKERIDKRAFRTLHHWSIILGIYTDTQELYDAYIENFGLTAEVENNMANYYVYIQQYEKSVVHMNYVLQNNEKLAKKNVLKILSDKGLLNK